MALSKDELFTPSSISTMEADSPSKHTLPEISQFIYSSNSSEQSSNKSSPSPTFHRPPLPPTLIVSGPTPNLMQQQHRTVHRRESLPSISYITQPLMTQDINSRRHSFASREVLNSSSSNTTKNSLPQHSTGNSSLSQQNSSSGVYTRSPELKISHKLAERKRRKEMKNLFDDLRDVLLIDKNVKVSKWEILSKAVRVIDHLRTREAQHLFEKEQLRKEINELKECVPTPTSTSTDSVSRGLPQ